MKETGLTPMQILQCATTNAARTFGGETGGKIGAVAPGKFADLVILNRTRSMTSRTRRTSTA